MAKSEGAPLAAPDPISISRLLRELEHGNRTALDELYPHVYQALSELAHRLRQRWQGDYTLNTTALVHEAYLKLVDQKRIRAASRAHFLAVAAKAMRHILVNYARDQRALKRGGSAERLSFDEMKLTPGEVLLTSRQADELVALHQALQTLEQIDARQVRVVECRLFAGMTVEETSRALDVAPRTVNRDWAMAQAWLHRTMGTSGE